MKTTITVSVRDGWLIFTRESEDDAGSRCFRVDTVIAVHDLSLWRDEGGVSIVTATRGGDEIVGVRARDVLELIHAGSGTITREVES